MGVLSVCLTGAQTRLSRAEYLDRAQAAWTGQIIAALSGFQFEHKVSESGLVLTDSIPGNPDHALVDDDYFYEMVALRGFEKYGASMTLDQLGEIWKATNAGAWGSSKETRLLLNKGIKGSETGHPRYNKLWYTIGPQFSAEVYGLLAPGMPNLAGQLARKYGHINGHAEAVDGAVFVAGAVSLGFVERDPRVIVRKAARLIHPSSPYRQMLDQVIALGESGASAEKMANAVEDRWHIEYPATNNAVANGGLVAVALWHGGGDYLKTINVAFRAADFTDTDCNAANAGAVIGAMHGMKALPRKVVEQLHDRIRGAEMGGVKFTQPVDETISGLAERTVTVGLQLAKGHREPKEIQTQPAELFRLGDLMEYWNPSWQLERAGFGGPGGGASGLLGHTWLEDGVLATFPRDLVRGLRFRRTLKAAQAGAALHIELRADEGKPFKLEVYANNTQLLSKTVEGKEPQRIDVDLSKFAGSEVELRVYQRVLGTGKLPGIAYWSKLEVVSR